MKIVSLSMASLVVASSLFATVDIDKKVFAFEKQRFLANQGITISEVKIFKKKKLSVDGWYGYVLRIKANVPGRGVVSGEDTLFSNGKVVAPELLSMKDGTSFKSVLEAKVTNSYYKKENLIAGNPDAKNRVVIFSDPLCPACVATLPSVIKKVTDNPKEIALYYYHFPLLQLHPAADTVSKAMVVLRKKGIKDVEMKIYTTNFSQYFSSKEKDPAKILAGVNKVFGTKITLKEINAIDVGNEVKGDVIMGKQVRIQGTPTIFVNGTNDKTRRLFGALAK